MASVGFHVIFSNMFSNPIQPQHSLVKRKHRNLLIGLVAYTSCPLSQETQENQPEALKIGMVAMKSSSKCGSSIFQRPTIKLVKLSIDYYIVDRIHKQHIEYYEWNVEQARPKYHAEGKVYQ